MRFGRWLTRRRRYQEIEPDEIFLDSKNLPGFDATRLEGKIEQAIEPAAFRNFVAIATLIGLLFLGQLFRLQVVDASTFAARAEANRLEEHTLIAERGTITDRTGVVLAENQTDSTEGFAPRIYPLGEAAAHLVGYVSYPKKDKNGYWSQKEIVGLAGVEQSYDSSLKGENGAEIQETDVHGTAVSGSIMRTATRGETLTLSIDAGLQQAIYDAIKAHAEGSGFTGGSAVLMDIHTGEVYALASYPSFDPAAVSRGGSEIAKLLTDSRSPFLDRAIGGLYAPGSVVKPYVAAAALQEGVITPDTQILSTGSISVPNPYDPKHPSIFKDWRVQGWMDLYHGIAYSSDVYFYEVGGGFENQRGIGVANIKKYLSMFGLAHGSGINLRGEADGTIPDPAWKAENFDGEAWLLGDTYHTAIGQYGFQVTTMELARAVSAIAAGGELVTPTLVAGTEGAHTSVAVSSDHLATVRQGMRLAVTDARGTALALAVPGVAAAGKTGTAQIGAHNESMNSTVEGFFPYDNPRFAFAIIMEHAKAGTLVGAAATAGDVLRYIVANRPDMVR